MLTKKQKNLLLFINKKLRSSGVSPSYEEMKQSLNLKSKSGIHRLISALEERGFIKRLAHKARALEVIKLPETASANDIYNSFSPSVIKGGLDDEKSIGESIFGLIRNSNLLNFFETVLNESNLLDREITFDNKIIRGKGSKLLDSNNEIIGAVIVFNDITKIKKLENIRKEFDDYRLPTWVRDLTGILKISCACMLQFDDANIVQLGAFGIMVLMIAAVTTHIRLKSTFRRYIASVAMLTISVLILYFSSI